MSNWNDDESYQPPEWLTQALRASAPSILADRDALSAGDPAFEGRCRQAAEAALNIARLRAERQRVGFVPLPFSDYVEGLVKLASVSMQPVLSWLGVESLSGLEPKVVNACARLARAVGLSLREAATLIRISFAAQVGSAPLSLVVARRRAAGPQRTPLETSEAALREVEAGYDYGTLVELRRVESELDAAYTASGGGGHES